ncbi:hypothetical protein HPB51_007403 [Rhipicephalus microplus]|uniref:Uncharacterized protein n=1 Tax=Rhipicephalus microplus TaxID=6941 RepID=A0A9J6EZ78_RHIMP|nr:hypothetical protein HPB51_007403 [Rhipicephalus microplus]
MEIVEGEAISQDEASSPGWMTVYGRKNSKGMRTTTTTRERTQTRGGRKGGGCTAIPRNAYQRIVATSKLPQLPRDTYHIIVRPMNGLNVTKVSQIRFEQALAMAVALAPAEIEEDTICPNGTENIYVVCTPHEKNACAYVKAQQVRLGDCTYRVSVYQAPPDDTCKGVIRGVDVDVSEAQLRARILNHRNPGAIETEHAKTDFKSHTSSEQKETTPTPPALREDADGPRKAVPGRLASRKKIQEELTWADRVKEKTPKPKKVTRSASPKHDELSDIEQLRQEIASLKAELRKQTAAQAISSRVEGGYVADNADHKSTQEPKVEVNQAKRRAPPPKDESDSEMQVQSSPSKC